MGMYGERRLRWDPYSGRYRHMTYVDQHVAQRKAERLRKGQVIVHIHNECSCCKNKTDGIERSHE